MTRRAAKICTLLGTAFLLGQCTYNPATGDRQFTAFLSPSQERQVGAEQHPQIVEQFGGEYDNARVTNYVERIGRELAADAEMPAEQFTFTVLDDPLVNAFALPGGYVYVTRGLMALANSEAELAGVVGHEIGHVTARHTAERYSRANAAGLGSTILGVLLGSPEVTQLAQQGSQLYLLSFSRGQELEADTLGVRYLTQSGYDPYAEADFLDTLGRYSELEATIAGQELPESDFLQTHPNTARRVRQAIEEAEGTDVRPDQAKRYPDRYLDMIDGMLFGQDPAQGIVRDGAFQHPDLGFAFAVPQNANVTNTPAAVVVQFGQNSGVMFDGADVPAGTPVMQYLQQDWAGELSLAGVRRFSVNGMEAASGTARASTENGVVELHMAVIRFSDDRVYRFQLISPPPAPDQLVAAFDEMVNSFRRLSAEGREAIQPYRIDVVTVQAGDTLQSLARRMPYDDGYNVQRLMVLNALRTENDIRPGQRLKIIVEG